MFYYVLIYLLSDAETAEDIPEHLIVCYLSGDTPKVEQRLTKVL